MTIDIDKAYDSINHSFLLCVFQKTGFRSEIIELIKILIKKQESFVINGGKTRTGNEIRRPDFSISLQLSF